MHDRLLPRKNPNKMDIQTLLAFAITLVGVVMGIAHQVNNNLNPAVADLAEALAKSEWSSALKRVFTTGDDCNTQFDQWVKQELSYFHLDQSELNFFEEYAVFDLAFYYKAFIDESVTHEYIGEYGQYTDELNARHHLCKNFWETTDPGDELDTHGILLMGAHGSDLEDLSKLVPTLRFLFELTYYEAHNVAHRIQNIIMTKSEKDYNSPLLTCNAVAAETEDVESRRGETGQSAPPRPSSIVMGDGILEFLEYINLERDGPDFVHSHEFGHHMQFQSDIDHNDRCDLDEYGEYKRLELMADAFSAYFLAHTLGGNMTSDAIDQLYQTAFSIGDCSEPGEESHGTPQQRECAAMWGAAQAKPPEGSPLLLGGSSSSSSSNTTILYPKVLRDRFDTALHHLFDLNQSVCMGLVIPNETIHCKSDDDDISTIGAIIFTIVFFFAAAAFIGLAVFFCCRRIGACRSTPPTEPAPSPAAIIQQTPKSSSIAVHTATPVVVSKPVMARYLVEDPAVSLQTHRPFEASTTNAHNSWTRAKNNYQ